MTVTMQFLLLALLGWVLHYRVMLARLRRQQALVVRLLELAPTGGHIVIYEDLIAHHEQVLLGESAP